MERGVGIYEPEEYEFNPPKTKETTDRYEQFFEQNPGIQDTIWWLLKSERTGYPPMSVYGLANLMTIQPAAFDAVMDFIVNSESKNAKYLMLFLVKQIEKQKEFQRQFQTKR